MSRQHLSDAATETVTESLLDAFAGGRARLLWLFLLLLFAAIGARAWRERRRRLERARELEARIDVLYGPLDAWRTQARALREAGTGLPPEERRAWLAQAWLPEVERVAETLATHASKVEQPDDAAPLHTYLGALKAHLAGAGDEPKYPNELDATWSARLAELRERATKLREGREEETRGSNDLP
jgi:hypothetical protein